MHRSAFKRFLFLTTAGVLLLPGLSVAADLPTGGQIVAGAGTINQSGNTMTIVQDTAKMAADWQSFSVGKNHTVNFQQPSSSSIALNRVLGSDVSVIQGSLNANGHVFLVNPNGVTFTPDAQVNVGGLVASTRSIKTEDFLDGNYAFEGSDSNAIINRGSINAPGGTVALIAAKIVNEGTITADNGNVMMGAGNKVVLDLGGPVKLEIQEGALETQIDQGGAVRADGGRVYLTAKAAGELATSVINHTGVTEAQTLVTGEKGEIVLLGDMNVGVVHVAGQLNATAPVGGNGGFIETSAAHVKVADDAAVMTKAVQGESGTWLIDPNDYTIAASGGDITGATLSTNLSGGNVVISTTGAGGNVIVDDAVSWAANKLTLSAHNNILVNQNLIATGTGSLAFEYGQDTANGAGSSYTVADGVKVLIPSADNFTWKKGSAGVVNKLWFGNDTLAITSTKDSALNQFGALKQPFYYDDGTHGRAAGWYKLTYSNYPLDFALGTDGDGTSSWNDNGEILSTNGYTNMSSAVNSLSIDIAGYREGTGTLVSTLNVDVAETSSTADIIHAYRLNADQNYIRTETTVKNQSTTDALTNVRLWVGTRDDWVGQSDSNYKTKGNLNGAFVPITAQNQQAKAIKVTEETDGTGAAILFYSISSGADTVTDSCCSFGNIIGKDPRASDILTPQEDGSYGLYLRMADLAAGESQSLVWYYAAAQASEIDNVITQVSQSAGATPPPTLPPSTIPKQTAVAAAQGTASSSTVQNVSHPQVVTNVALPSNGQTMQGATSVGSMETVEVESEGGNLEEALTVAGLGDQSGLMGPTKVFVVDGGVKLPSSVEHDDESE